MQRRHLLQTGMLASLVLLLDRGHALMGSLGRDRYAWFGRIDALCAALRGQALTDAEWREALDRLFGRVELDDLLTAIDYDRLRCEIGFAGKGVTTARIDTGGRRLSFFPKMFAVGRGRAVIPHGHAGMVSAHFVLNGRMRLRQYDQLERSDTHMLVRPTRDEIITRGNLSSIGLAEENVHWFVAHEPSHTLDVIVVGLEEYGATFDIFNLDMDEAESVEGDLLQVPRLDVGTALAKYG